MHSMTGYGRGESSAQGYHCIVECASVNRKGAEVSLQLPREIAALEVELREMIMGRIARGRVSVTVSVECPPAEQRPLLDVAFARAAAAQLQELQRQLSIEGGLSLATLLAFPGVLQTPSLETTGIAAALKSALDSALEEMIAMRRKEGAALERDLSERIRTLRGMLSTMQGLAPQVTERYRNQLRKRIDEIGPDLSLSDPRLATEVALLAERSDISEELTRIASHLDQFAEKLDQEGASGRALEFLTQEIFRELNTIGSKAGDSALSRLVVESKVEIDKIREQSLNVE